MADTTASTAELVAALSPARGSGSGSAPAPAPVDDDPMAKFLHNAEVLCAQTAPDSAPPPAAPPPTAAMGSGFGFLSATVPAAASPAARPPAAAVPAAGGMMMDANMFNLSASPLATPAAQGGGFSALLAAPPSSMGLGAISDADVSSLAGSLGLPCGSSVFKASPARKAAPTLCGLPSVPSSHQPTPPFQSAA
jgi:hypothetical protein